MNEYYTHKLYLESKRVHETKVYAFNAVFTIYTSTCSPDVANDHTGRQLSDASFKDFYT